MVERSRFHESTIKQAPPITPQELLDNTQDVGDLTLITSPIFSFKIQRPGIISSEYLAVMPEVRLTGYSLISLLEEVAPIEFGDFTSDVKKAIEDDWIMPEKAERDSPYYRDLLALHEKMGRHWRDYIPHNDIFLEAIGSIDETRSLAQSINHVAQFFAADPTQSEEFNKMAQTVAIELDEEVQPYEGYSAEEVDIALRSIVPVLHWQTDRLGRRRMNMRFLEGTPYDEILEGFIQGYAIPSEWGVFDTRRFSPVLGLLVDGYLSSEITYNWPEEQEIEGKSNFMGPAQVPVLALQRRRELARSLFMDALEGYINAHAA